MRKKSGQEAKDEIEKGISGVRRAVGAPISSFFLGATPYLARPTSHPHLSRSRNVAMFSTDVDSFDFRAPDRREARREHHEEAGEERQASS